MATCVAWQTPAGARPNRRRAAVLCDQDAAGWLLECVGDHGPREMTVRNFGSDRTRLTGPPSSRPVVASCGSGAFSYVGLSYRGATEATARAAEAAAILNGAWGTGRSVQTPEDFCRCSLCSPQRFLRDSVVSKARVRAGKEPDPKTRKGFDGEGRAPSSKQ